jgi:hypothetical protein
VSGLVYEFFSSIMTGLCRAADLIITMLFIPLLVLAYAIDTTVKQLKGGG